MANNNEPQVVPSIFPFSVNYHENQSQWTHASGEVYELPVTQPNTVNYALLAAPIKGYTQNYPAGMYYWSNDSWRLVLDAEDVSKAVLDESTVDVYYKWHLAVTVSSTDQVFKNGQKQTGITSIPANDPSVWTVVVPGSGAGSGSVTSVGLTAPTDFTVTGSPVTSSGSITLAYKTQTANTVLAGPDTGTAAEPAFRALVAADIPTIPVAKVTGAVSNTSPSFTGPVTATGNISTTGGTNPATNTSGVDMWATGGFGRIALTDAAGAANKKVGLIQFTTEQMDIGFGSDQYNGLKPFITAKGDFTAITTVETNGTWNNNGSYTVTGAQGTVNLNPVAQGGGGISFFDSTRTGNNHVAQWIWYNGALSARFLNDAGNATKTPISFAGGETAITGITSDSGTGAWTHTGQFITAGGSPGTGSSSSLVVRAGANPDMASIAWDAVGAPADSKWWSAYATPTGSLIFNLVNDANTGATTWLSVARTGTTISGITSNSGSGSWAHTGAMTVSTTLTATGKVSAAEFVGTKDYTHATLPAAASNKGMRTFITDGPATPVFGDASAGGGTKFCPVYCDGTSWFFG